MTTSNAQARRESFHHVVFLPSLFWSRNRPDFYAVTCGLCPEGIQFRSAVIPGLGERLTCSIGHVGIVDVEIARAAENTFTAKPAGGRHRNAAIARMLVELAERQTTRSERAGASPRVVPRRTELAVTLADGAILKGRLVGVSISGADVYLGASVDVGTRIRLGATEAVVAQSFGNGIGAYFLSPLDPGLLNENLVL